MIMDTAVLGEIKSKFAHWNQNADKRLRGRDDSGGDCSDIGSDCHGDGECGGDGE